MADHKDEPDYLGCGIAIVFALLFLICFLTLVNEVSWI